jgi:hypothetical protein
VYAEVLSAVKVVASVDVYTDMLLSLALVNAVNTYRVLVVLAAAAGPAGALRNAAPASNTTAAR